MTDYRTIRGKKVKFFETDLSGGEVEGQLFFSDTSKEMKIAVSSAAWHSEAPIKSGRTVAQGATGTATAGLICFGNPADAPYTLNETEEYNGSSWAIGGDTTHASSNATAAGTQTAAIAMGISDSPTTVTIKYDGTSWTDSGHAFPSTGGAGVGSGTQTATLYSGQGSGTNSYEYDGSSWTSGGTMNTSRVGEGTGWGPQTSALMCTGRGSPSALTSATEEYDGTSWTSTNNVNAARRRISGSQNSTSQDSGIIFGGSPTSNPNAGATVNTEQYDGSSWTEITNLSTGRNHAGGAGNSTSAWVAGSNPNSALTEEFNITALTVTAAAFSSGGNLPSAKRLMGAAGTQTAGLVFGGFDGGGGLNTTEEYGGDSWTSGGSMNTGRWNLQGAGTQTAGLASGGARNSPFSLKLEVEEYNGSSWSEQNDIPGPSYGGAGFGTQTAAIVCGGSNPTNSPTTFVNTTFEYDGGSWTNGGAMNTARESVAGAGTQTAGLAAFGANPNRTTVSEEYDGSSWTSGNNGNFTRAVSASFGIQTAAIFAGGPIPPVTANCESYDGTSFSTSPSLATAREGQGKGPHGTTSAGLVSGGETSTATVNATEEFTGETTSLNLKTITDS